MIHSPFRSGKARQMLLLQEAEAKQRIHEALVFYSSPQRHMVEVLGDWLIASGTKLRNSVKNTSNRGVTGLQSTSEPYTKITFSQ